ncbi:hypothetical protein Dimus_006465, partial [Dionaea muscipula]
RRRAVPMPGPSHDGRSATNETVSPCLGGSIHGTAEKAKGVSDVEQTVSSRKKMHHDEKSPDLRPSTPRSKQFIEHVVCKCECERSPTMSLEHCPCWGVAHSRARCTLIRVWNIYFVVPLSWPSWRLEAAMSMGDDSARSDGSYSMLKDHLGDQNSGVVSGRSVSKKGK